MPEDDDIQLEPVASRRGRGNALPLVLMRHEVQADIDAHAREDLNRELGGFLLGTAASSGEGTVVVVEAAVRALHTEASRGSVTFTHATWEEFNRVKDRDYPDKRVVGWYHTHPGYGLFLSSYDLFIHQNFFNLPWQVAYVVDPRAGTSGCFVWDAEEIRGPEDVELAGVPAQVSPSPVPAPATGVPEPAPTPAEGSRWRWAMASALALVLALQVYSLSRGPVSPASEVNVPEPPWVSRVLQGPQTAETAPPPAQEGEMAAQDRYTVQPGDSLWRIAVAFYGDGALWGAIAVANDLGPDDLEPGMVLQVPRPTPGKAGPTGDN